MKRNLYKEKRSKIDNRGLYAADDIKKGAKIIQYKGKIITVKESETNPPPNPKKENIKQTLKLKENENTL